MTDATREARLASAFVKLADTLTADYDMIDLLDMLVSECVTLLDADAGGLMITDPVARRLELVVSTSEEAGFVEINQLNAGDGPCIDCYTSGKAVSVGDIRTESESERWPSFRRVALESSFHSMHAFPLKLRGTVIGAMNLFSTTPGELTDDDVTVGQALADVATIGILQERSIRDQSVLAGQLQRALDSRVIIEQAKGIVSYAAGVDMDQAFSAIRAYSRNHNLLLSEVAARIAHRELDITMGTFTKR